MRKKKLPTIPLLKKDPFGNYIILKRFLIGVVGAVTYPRFALTNSMKIEGTEHIENLPNTNVIFLSNHQTYFADVIAFYHIFCSVKWHFKNTINFPLYLLMPRVNNFYVAAEETMKDGGMIPRILSYAGAVTIKRSWRAKGQNVNRNVDENAFDKIKMALKQGWVVSFPQGTTSPYAPIRKGTAHLIKQLNPIVVPVVINGFRRAFDKKGLFYKKRGVKLEVKFKAPIVFPDNLSIDEIVETVREIIEQNPEEHKKNPEG
ncbi:lysophospholipid acyltransferase family protein [Flexithrix dorotheae]|uniref:lysophospholipid acyltransferase family protein n=1 Tax=Flexithrix dorotheae TaxID=70993 RepID=UPI0003680072|nr:lysophospholipid acyltransferase family protein [Flexithrix dorotheae]